MKKATISNCCYANILYADEHGQGKCSECKENCVPETDLETASPVIETVTGLAQDIPDLSWSVVFLIAALLFVVRLIQDNFPPLL